MQLLDGRLVISATDLSDFLACEHLASLKKRRALGEDIRRDEDALSDILSQLGSDHERTCLDRYIAERPRVMTFDEERTRGAHSLSELEDVAAETVAAMRAGYDVIYQPFFLHGMWSGRADFLIRVATPSDLGDFSYEVADAKLARRVRAEAVLQLCEYSQHVARIQGLMPGSIHVLLGNGETHVYPLDDFTAYHASVRERLQHAVLQGFGDTYPERVQHCGVCSFATLCDARRHADDHLSTVARMRGHQIRHLSAAGVTTVQQLAALTPDSAVPRLPSPTLEGLRRQARLQKEGPLPDGRPRHELIGVIDPGLGLCALPAPSPGDVFFDMEGDPLARDEPLEYLFGVTYTDPDGMQRYRCWEGHDAAAERAAFEGFVDWLMQRLTQHPDMHVYHYAAYERTALQRLMSRHGTRENDVDNLLRKEVLVDLYRVVYQGVRLSTESYGLKAVEHLYMPPRTGEVADGMASVVMYERWRATGDDPASRARALIDEIIRYNEVDCRSTAGLRGWLEEQRAVMEAQLGSPLARPAPKEPVEDTRSAERTQHEEALRAQLVGGLPVERDARGSEEQARWLLGQHIAYHHREERSEWWRYFRRLELTEEQLVEDRDALGPLTHVQSIDPSEKGQVDRYSFSPQEHHVGDGRVDDPLRLNAKGTRGLAAGTVVAVDNVRGTIDLKRSAKHVEQGHPLFLVPGSPFPAGVQAESLGDLARAVLEQGIDAPRGWRAGCDLLLRRAPAPAEPGASLQREGETGVTAALRVLASSPGACLAVQGPPGAGKTYTGARIAIERAAHGVVGVTALSHRAISNLLDEICSAREGPSVRVGQRVGSDARCCADDLVSFNDNGAVTAALDEARVDVIGGTSWLFARPELTGRFDTLIVDEAGQMSLADVLAMSRCAKHLVLLGDPRQLPQVVQGIHPDGAEASALQHFLGDDVTIPADRGLFLAHTRRMCPPLCDFVSTAFYQGRLEADASCAQQQILTPAGPLSGARRVPVAHAGDRMSSEAEAIAVREIVGSLLGLPWRDQHGAVRPLTLRDILVVAPYNAHVACLVSHLHDGARVGTVDKFQGQEAAVSIFSMATSSTDDLPRNLEFLFSLNRLNVAISRARCLSVLVYSPELVQAHCSTPAQMRLVNALCRYEQWADPLDIAAPDTAAPSQLQLLAT